MEIEELIEKLVKEKIETYDFKEMVEDYARSTIRSIILEQAKQYDQEYINNIIKENIETILAGSIDTDDGWGEKKHYDSFEDMFKERFKKKLDDTWEIKRVIERTVKDRLDDLFAKKTKEMTTKIQDMVLNEMIKEEQK